MEEESLKARPIGSVQVGDDEQHIFSNSDPSPRPEAMTLLNVDLSARWTRRKVRARGGEEVDTPLVKDGQPSVQRASIERQRFFQDFFLTVVQWQWYFSLSFVGLVYIVSWLIFAGCWLAVPDDCAIGAGNFTSAFLLSVELQVTIGFGNVYISSDCRVGAFLLTAQCVVGLVLDAILLGLILTKAARAKSRAKTVIFSKKVVVCQRNGDLCLLFRVADIRNRSMCEAHVRAYCYSSRRTREGEHLDWEYEELDVGYDTGRDRLLMILPCTVCHKITDTSPFYRMDAQSLAAADFEIVVLVEGVIEATGCTAQVLTSYQPKDVLWAHRFLPMVFRSRNGQLTIDYGRLDSVTADSTPLYAASQLASNENETARAENETLTDHV